MITFSQAWQHEQTAELSQQIFSMLDNLQVIEQVEGADRQYFRFEWYQHMFILQFECYGQSVWIEAENILAQEFMPKMLSNLERSLG